MAVNPTPQDAGQGRPAQDAGVGTGPGQGTGPGRGSGDDTMPGGGFVVVKQPSQSGCAVAAQHNESPIKVLIILVVLLALRRRTSTVVIDD